MSSNFFWFRDFLDCVGLIKVGFFIDWLVLDCEFSLKIIVRGESVLVLWFCGAITSLNAILFVYFLIFFLSLLNTISNIIFDINFDLICICSIFFIFVVVFSNFLIFLTFFFLCAFWCKSTLRNFSCQRFRGLGCLKIFAILASKSSKISSSGGTGCIFKIQLIIFHVFTQHWWEWSCSYTSSEDHEMLIVTIMLSRSSIWSHDSDSWVRRSIFLAIYSNFLQLFGPISDRGNMKADIFFVFGGWRQTEGMPLHRRYLRDVDKSVLTSIIIEILGSMNLEIDQFWAQVFQMGYLFLAKAGLEEHNDLLQNQDSSRENDPPMELPDIEESLRTMHWQQNK